MASPTSLLLHYDVSRYLLVRRCPFLTTTPPRRSGGAAVRLPAKSVTLVPRGVRMSGGSSTRVLLGARRKETIEKQQMAPHPPAQNGSNRVKETNEIKDNAQMDRSAAIEKGQESNTHTHIHVNNQQEIRG